MAAGDVRRAYGSSSSLTITLASLASSSDFTAGRESTAVSNTSTLALDYLIAGKITTGTSPSAGTQIQVGIYGSMNDTPTYGDVLDGTDSAETFTSANVMAAILKYLPAIIIDSTSDRGYSFGPYSVAQLFGGAVPKNFGVFVAHNTSVNLNATGGNHFIDITPIFATVAQS